MDDTRWLRWLVRVTHEKTIRSIAQAAGVSHTTARRWTVKGVPPDKAWDIVIRFHGDPIELLVLLGRIAPEQVGELNHAALAEYIPTAVMTAELHRRAVEAGRRYPEATLRKTRVWH